MSSDTPAVSIVIPVYNGSNYLAQAIESALAQSCRDTEVLVINDGSTDGGATEEIALRYRDRIRYFRKENGGVSSALNYGISQMRGQWFSWLSHDDLYEPIKVERQLAFAAGDSSIRFVYSRCRRINESGQELSPPSEDWQVPFAAQLRELLKMNRIMGCATLIHREVFETVGRFNEKNRTAQDYEMWIRIAARYGLHALPELLVRQRVHGEMGSITAAPQNCRDMVDVIRRVLTELPVEAIFKDRLAAGQNNKRLASSYRELGDLLVFYWNLEESAADYYERANALDPSLRSSIPLRTLACRVLSKGRRVFNQVSSRLNLEYRL